MLCCRDALPALALLLAVLQLVSCLWCACAVPVISNITGCVAQSGAVTSGCVEGSGQSTSLTISGSGLPQQGGLINVSGIWCPIASGATDTRVVCSVSGLYHGLSYNTPLPVTAVNLVSQQSSAAVLDVSFSRNPGFTVSSISGCIDVGSSTTGCTVDGTSSSSVLTIRGSGFTGGQLGVWSWRLQWTTSGAQPSSIKAWRSSLPGPQWFTFNGSSLAFWNLRYAFRPTPLSAVGNLTFFITRDGEMAVDNGIFTVGFIATANNSAPPVPAESGPILVDSVSGCPQQMGNATSGCLQPTQLTIAGAGFPQAQALVVVAGQQCDILLSSPTELLCSLSYLASAQQWDVLLPVVVYDLQRTVQSAPFMGVELQLTRPYIANISGCQGSGLSTMACDLDVDTLTLSGSGFSALNLQLFFFSGASAAYSLYSAYIQPSMLSGDSLIVFPTSAWADPMRAAIAGYGNSSIAFWLASADILSNFVSVGFAPVRLNVSSISGCSTPLLTGPTAVTGCYATSVLTIRGLNFYTAVSISVAGGPCLVTGQQFTYIVCTLSVPDGYQAGIGYDLVLQTGPDNILVVTGAVSFTSAPTVYTVTSAYCPALMPSDYAQAGPVLRCGLGDVLTIVGSLFTSDILNVSITTAAGIGPYPAVLCSNATAVSSSIVSCVLQDVPVAGSQAWYSQLQVFVNATTASNIAVVFPYRPIGSPSVTNVSGCASADAVTRGVSGCIAGDVVTIAGSSIEAGSTAQLYDPDTDELYACARPVALSSAVMNCVLPYVVAATETAVYAVRITNLLQQSSNWLLAVNYGIANAGVGNNESSDGYYSRWVISLALLVPIVATLLVLDILLLTRRGQKRGHPELSPLDVSSSTRFEVEMR